MNLMISSLSLSSRKFYAHALSSFRQFVVVHLLKDNWFPASVWSISTYVAFMINKGLAPSTVSSHLSVLSFFHKIVGCQDPTSTFFVKKMVIGANKLYKTVDHRSPISIELLRKLVDSTDYVSKSSYESLLFKSLYILMFHAFLRIGEVTSSVNNILFSNVQVTAQSVSITFQKFKHHSGFPIVISIPFSGNRYCPVLLTAAYLVQRGNFPGPFFAFPGSVPIQPSYFNSVFASSLAWAKCSDPNIKPHSFRIGAATWAASKGFSDNQIQVMGRWKSSAFKKYIRIQTFNISL